MNVADILSIGELLIDFIELTDENGDVYYKRNAGGAPANVVCMAAKLGASAGLISKIGGDMFGDYLKKVIEDIGVDTSGLIVDKDFRTSLAFIRKNDDGARDYVFYRKNTADLNLNFNEVRLKLIDECKIFHFGGLSLIREPSKSAVLNSVEYAKSKGKIISFDPNYKPKLWSNTDAAAKSMQNAVRYADIIKVSENELQLISDCGNLLPAVAKLLNEGVKIICVTQGAKGCIIATNSSVELYSSYKAESVDTIGSGDSFLGGFLFKLLEKAKDISELSMNEIYDMAMYANACGALSSMKTGAIPSMPSQSEVDSFMEKNKNLAEGGVL